MKNIDDRYLLEIAQYEILNDEQNAALRKMLKSPVTTVRTKAKEQLICSCLRLVVKRAALLARKYAVSADELVGVGNEALVHAADSYDPDRKAKFSTYVWPIVWRRMKAYYRKQYFERQACIMDTEFLVYVAPDYSKEDYDSLRKVMEALTPLEREIVHYSFFDDFEPLDREIARKLRIGVHSLKKQREEIYAKLRHLLQKQHHSGSLAKAEANHA